MFEYIAFIVFPIALGGLLVSVHYLLENSKNIGLAIGTSPFVIGLFIVAIGTSLPEAVIAVFATYQGVLDVAVSQTIGSNIANILLVLGIASAVAGRLTITKNLIDQEIPILAAVSLLFLFTLFDQEITRIEGALLLIGLGLYIGYIFNSTDNRQQATEYSDILTSIRKIPLNIIVFVIAAIGIAITSHITVNSLIDIADILKIPEGIIAVTILALGTSLPEIVVSVQAVRKGDIELAIGNVIGSNVFNILFVIGIPSFFISPLLINTESAFIQIVAFVGVTILFIVSGISNQVSRWEGLFFILLYLLFIGHISGIL